MENSGVESLLQEYQKELLEDLKIDEINLKEKTMLIPTIKHKWVARQMTHKSQLKKLDALKKKAIAELTANMPIALSKTAIADASVNNPKIAAICEKIENLEIIIEYLEKVEKTISSLTFDCKNVIDLQKLETT